MAIAYSNGPVLYTKSIRCDTSANLRADLDAALTSVNWARVAVTNGFKYTITSPQGLQSKVLIQDQGTGYVIIQFLSMDETKQGLAHSIQYAATYASIGYELVANQCQMFLALNGVADLVIPTGGGANQRYYSIAGGIPYVANPAPGTECALSGGTNAAVSQIFWSSSEAAFNADIRTGWCPTSSFSYLLNSTLYSQAPVIDNAGPATPYTGNLQIFPFTPTRDIGSGYYAPSVARVERWGTLSPLYVDAFIGWGFAIQGQIWDAFQATADQTLESILISTETAPNGATVRARWLSWNHYMTGAGTGTYYGTLYLLTGKPFVQRNNYAY